MGKAPQPRKQPRSASRQQQGEKEEYSAPKKREIKRCSGGSEEEAVTRHPKNPKNANQNPHNPNQNPRQKNKKTRQNTWVAHGGNGFRKSTSLPIWGRRVSDPLIHKRSKKPGGKGGEIVNLTLNYQPSLPFGCKARESSKTW